MPTSRDSNQPVSRHYAELNGTHHHQLSGATYPVRQSSEGDTRPSEFPVFESQDVDYAEAMSIDPPLQEESDAAFDFNAPGQSPLGSLQWHSPDVVMATTSSDQMWRDANSMAEPQQPFQPGEANIETQQDSSQPHSSSFPIRQFLAADRPYEHLAYCLETRDQLNETIPGYPPEVSRPGSITLSPPSSLDEPWLEAAQARIASSLHQQVGLSCEMLSASQLAAQSRYIR